MRVGSEDEEGPGAPGAVEVALSVCSSFILTSPSDCNYYSNFSFPIRTSFPGS